MSEISSTSALRAQSFENAMTSSQKVDVYPPLSKVIHNAANTSWIVALGAGILVALLLIIMKPPLVQTKPQNSLQEPKLNLQKVALWSLLTALAAFLIPKSIELFQKNKK